MDVEYPWEILKLIKNLIVCIGNSLPSDEYEQIAQDTWVARDACVFDSVYLAGPAIIGHNAEIRHCAFIRGAALIGDGVVVGNSVEIKNSILFDRVQVPHYNYVGDSILGYKAHMGAGSITSNVKSDKKNVVVHINDVHIETGLRKFGAILGDRVEVGCNSVLNPGSVIGRDSMIYPTSCVRGFVPERSIFKNSGAVIDRLMEG
ncbi:MAG: UDP-N-acetylglucosamine pyrophosphorylase [Clostridia bacterium]|nr:UDP-N-acetylglucosamine pyrophosphorylase [Clostridia bacterium]